MLEKQIEQDLKTALLGGDRLKADTLRGLKSALLYAKVEKGKREVGLSSEEEVAVLSRESKKRLDSIEAYRRGGSEERANREQSEKDLIDHYLPTPISDTDLRVMIQQTINELGAKDISSMGEVINAVKTKTNATADGGTIAAIVKECLVK